MGKGDDHEKNIIWSVDISCLLIKADKMRALQRR
jgi:hypothetical protein